MKKNNSNEWLKPLSWGVMIFTLIGFLRSSWGFGKNNQSIFDWFLGLFSNGNGNGGNDNAGGGNDNAGGGNDNAGGGSVLVVGHLEPVDILGYKSKYFKVSEYFGSVVPPSDKVYAYKKLFIRLDKIREMWGSPVYIKAGYSFYRDCDSVQIRPKNGKIKSFFNLIKQLNDGGMLGFSKVVRNTQGNVYLKF